LDTFFLDGFERLLQALAGVEVASTSDLLPDSAFNGSTRMDIGKIALILGAIASIYAILAGIEQGTGSRALRWTVAPFMRLKNWTGAPRRDIAKLQEQVAALQKKQRSHEEESPAFFQGMLFRESEKNKPLFESTP
jgi:hypothetical protein